MKMTDIARLRLINQKIGSAEYSSPQKLVHQMGALQAQDYNMAKWAIGVRLPGASRKTIETAIEKGEIIRTHLLRPTWHFVAAKDLRWMIELTAPRIKIAMRSRHKQLGLTEEVITRSNSVIEQALARHTSLTRKVLVAELEAAGFANINNLASHLLIRAEQEGVICSGPTNGKHYTYALLDERLPASPPLTKEDALARLARMYFKSHGPATLEDFVWWSGLTKTTARKALQMVEAEFTSADVVSNTYWLADIPYDTKAGSSVFLLPAYDEFIISYKDRSAILREEHHPKAMSNNGIFWPVIVLNGQVIGTWKRSLKKECVWVEADFFNHPDQKTRTWVERAAERFADFLGKELKLMSKP